MGGATIFPIQKAGDEDKVSNYREVSLLNIWIITKMVKRLNIWIERRNTQRKSGKVQGKAGDHESHIYTKRSNQQEAEKGGGDYMWPSLTSGRLSIWLTERF